MARWFIVTDHTVLTYNHRFVIIASDY